MASNNPKTAKTKWQAVFIITVIAIWIHLYAVYGMKLLGFFETEEPKRNVEISLLKEPEETKTDKPGEIQPEEAPPKEPEMPKKIVPIRPVPPTPRQQVKPMPHQNQEEDASPVEAEELTETPIPEGPEVPKPAATDPAAEKPTPTKLVTQLNWGAFQRTMGQEFEQQQHAYHAEIHNKKGGGYKFGRMSAKVKKALHSNRSWVADAPKAPVGTKRVLFKNYLDATHENIHSLFADSFLPSLVSLGPDHPLNDFSLMTMLEFKILANGIVEEVRVLRTSGHAIFDSAAVDSIYRASPFMPTPSNIRSYDNKVYFRWGFYRNMRKCGTFNATGYILTGPGGQMNPIGEQQFSIIDG